MDSVRINVDEHVDYLSTMAQFNQCISTAVKKYERKGITDNAIEALALYNFMLIHPRDNNYGIEHTDWANFTSFVEKDLIEVCELTTIEKDVISSVNSEKISFGDFDQLQRKLQQSNSTKTVEILELLKNKGRVEEDVLTDEEDVLIMDPFLRRIDGTVVHGNTHPLPLEKSRSHEVQVDW